MVAVDPTPTWPELPVPQHLTDPSLCLAQTAYCETAISTGSIIVTAELDVKRPASVTRTVEDSVTAGAVNKPEPELIGSSKIFVGEFWDFKLSKFVI